MNELQQAGIAAAAIMKGHELHEDRYFKSIDYFQPVELPQGGSELQRGRIVRFDRDVLVANHHLRAPHLGEHTVEIMKELLAASTSEIESLLVQGAISTTYNEDSSAT